ncbi:MAG: sporulation initiation factor Spo0A C-terminal domain-containing protein [Firmicutes bacterium]|nr:sporulation initiation factor Spo0A C-terminal domain-containing protein [Bacillota bacterium]
MTDMELLTEKVKAIIDFELATTQQERSKAELKIRDLQSRTSNPAQTAEQILRRILFELGVPEHLVGYQYIIDAVLMVVDEPKLINRLSGDGLYLLVGNKNGVTASKVERGIRFAVDRVFLNCDADILYRYFGNTIDPDRGKATNGGFIARMANVVREQMKRN